MVKTAFLGKAMARELSGTRQGQSFGIDLTNHTTTPIPVSTAVA